MSDTNPFASPQVDAEPVRSPAHGRRQRTPQELMLRGLRVRSVSAFVMTLGALALAFGFNLLLAFDGHLIRGVWLSVSAVASLILFLFWFRWSREARRIRQRLSDPTFEWNTERRRLRSSMIWLAVPAMLVFAIFTIVSTAEYLYDTSGDFTQVLTYFVMVLVSYGSLVQAIALWMAIPPAQAFRAVLNP